MAAFEPSPTLRSRTFIGLITAQFLAAFNDQAIHASSMFFAIHKGILDKQTAISLMPVLFYAPWAIFCTLAGYLADRYSKRDSLVFWKVAEVGITLIALLGFWLGSGSGNHSPLGPWIVLATVFLMGTHSAFFVPAKYGAMPEILQPHKLSMGNGILESTSFLAVILGTVGGGILSFVFRRQGQEYVIGLILVGLALIGAAASLMIRRMPAANPTRPFPTNLIQPLTNNLKILARSRPLALAVLGVAFFTFMVAFMRATMYMHGETHHWDEFETSLVVATVALGVGLGSPLAGKLSGGKVELGLVPLGAVGMIVATLIASAVIFNVTALIATLILIGFFSGFYIVPLYTLLQYRAPKTSKGDLIATSNFVNVTGAIAASVLFFLLGLLASTVGLARPVPAEDVHENVATGELIELHKSWLGRPTYLVVQTREGFFEAGRPPRRPTDASFARQALYVLRGVFRKQENPGDLIEADTEIRTGGLVSVSRYGVRGTRHFIVQPAGKPLKPPRDEARVPRFLFIGASLMTLAILLVLCRQLPDFFVRSLLWLRTHGRARARVVGFHNLPPEGPVILATNCDRFESCMSVVAATDRFTRFILLESSADPEPRPLLRYLARRTGLVALHPPHVTTEQRDKALASAERALREGNLLGVTAEGSDAPEQAEAFLTDLRARRDVPVLPVYCGALTGVPPNGEAHHPRVRVVIGPPVPARASARDVRRAIRALGEWIGRTESSGEIPATVRIPGAAAASPTGPAASRPAPPSPR